MKDKVKLILFSHLSDLYGANGKEARIKIEFSKYLISKYINNVSIDPDAEFEEFKQKYGDRLRINDSKQSVGNKLQNLLSPILEVTVEDPEIARQVDELGRLINEIKRLKDQMKVLEQNAKKIEDTIRPILDEMKDTEERILETQNTIAYIERRGGTKSNPKYKEAYLLSLTKVNSTIRAILEEALAATTETSTFKSTISARPREGVIREGLGEFFGGLWSKLKGLVSRLKSKNSDLKKYNDILKKLSK